MNNIALSFFLALGGALGTLARYWIGVAATPYSNALPWGTVVINIIGSFVIGFFGTLTLSGGKFAVSEPMRLFVMVGFCGGFTTFSAFSLQTFDLLRGGAFGRAALNVALSVALCIAATAAGNAFAARLNGGAVAVAQIDAEREA